VTSRLIEATNSGRTVLVPNIEMAAALTDAIERAHRDAGREIWPTPRVRDFASWLRDRHVRRQLDDSTLPRCLTDVEERELWREAILDSDLDHRFLDPAGAARAARNAHRTASEYGIPLHAVAADTAEESVMFVQWSARFAERCRELGGMSTDELLTRRGGSAPGEEIAWIESPLWRPVARRWLERFGGEPLAPIMAMHGPEEERLRVRRFAGAPDELAAIAEWSRNQLVARPEFRAWICVPDLVSRRAELVDAFDAALAPHRFALYETAAGAPYAIAGGTPLSGHAPVRFALEWLAAAHGRISFASFSALLRAPELSGSAEEAGAAACLDVALRSRAPAQSMLSDWLALAQQVEGAQRLRPAGAVRRMTAALQPLAELGGHHPMSRWLAAWIAAFEAGAWSNKSHWSSAEYQAAERFRELLATLASCEASFSGQSRATAEGILRRAARDTSFQPQTGVPPIWVSGQWSDPWLAYDGIWVASCDETRWPPPVEPVPLLPIRLQRDYGVVAASMEAQLRFAEDLQRRWAERATSRTFSCADAEDGRRAVPSPLLARRRRSADGASGRVFAASEPVASYPHWRAQLERAPPLERVDDELAPPFGAEERTRGVATLRSQSRCAFRAFAETRLKAERLEFPVPGFNERERGELVHESLERIWSELGGSAGLAAILGRPDELERLMTQSVRRAIAARSAKRDPGAIWRDREEERLMRLIRRWLELESERDAFEVERLEEGAEIARHAGLDFSVRIDRIDRLPDGARLLIDYKTGAASADWRGDRPDNPQLPIYALLHRESLIAVAYGRINAAGCGFFSESERNSVFPRKRASALEGMASFAQLLDLWSGRIERLAREFREGRAAVDPLPTACRSCHLQGLCRVPSTLDAAETPGEPAEGA
jgi:probable DNA repair protein